MSMMIQDEINKKVEMEYIHKLENPNIRIDNGKVQIKVYDKWITPRLDKYENVEITGNPGANGIVFKGIHKITKREDAIKIWIPRKETKNGQIKENQYYTEIQKIAQLNHPNIVKIYDAWIEEGCYCCSMEYINGTTMKEWLKKHRKKEERLNLLLDIFTTIQYYQENGIIHGDIHTKNILIDNYNKVHIIDFGTSVTSRYENQSKERENYLMYELVQQTLGDDFSEDAFLVKKYSICGPIKEINDVIGVNSLLLCKSFLEYIELEVYRNNIEYADNYMDLVKICEGIAKGVYINMDFLFKNMVKWCAPMLIRQFPKAFYEALEDIIYADIQQDSNKIERIKYLSLYVYYEGYKKIQSQLNSRKLREVYKALSKVMSENEFNRYVGFINQNADLFKLHSYLKEKYIDDCEVYKVEDDIRQLIYEVLTSFHNKMYLYIFREQYLQMEIIKMDEKLYEKIGRLSYIYCLNNGYDSM